MTGVPVTENIPGRDKPTLVTLPLPVPPGRSAAVNARNVGVPLPPLAGPANTVFCASLANDTVNVPDPVTGLPDTEKMAGMDRPTDVTVPEPAELEPTLVQMPPLKTLPTESVPDAPIVVPIL